MPETEPPPKSRWRQDPGGGATPLGALVAVCLGVALVYGALSGAVPLLSTGKPLEEVLGVLLLLGAIAGVFFLMAAAYYRGPKPPAQ